MHTQTSHEPARRARIVAVHPLPGVRAGSGLLRFGDRLLAIQDDAWCVVWIALPGLERKEQPLKGDGAPLPKKHKPDFEAAVSVSDGSIHLLGSGSTSNRCGVVRIDPDHLTVHLTERPDIHDCVREALRLTGRPNIEGAVATGDRLRLFHRGVGAAHSAWVDLPLATLEGAAPRVQPRALAWHEFDLGQLEGVPCHFTDAATIGADLTMFLATAEDTDSAIADGPVVGSIIGQIHESHAAPLVSWTRLLEADGQPSRRKAEGLAVDDDGRGAWVLTDPDATHGVAELCRVMMDPVKCL